LKSVILDTTFQDTSVQRYTFHVFRYFTDEKNSGSAWQ